MTMARIWVVVGPCGLVALNGTPLLSNGSSAGLFTPFIIPLLLTGLVTIPAGLYAFMRAERYAKRTGKLKRNG